MRMWGLWEVTRSQALMMGLVLLRKRFQALPAPSHMQGHSEKVAMNQEAALTRPDHASTLTFDFQPPDL